MMRFTLGVYYKKHAFLVAINPEIQKISYIIKLPQLGF